ncbi:CHAP domain-containing protein [Aquimarina muelleri]|uniref:CHAP domain-containing protein n=1 Tax=Aquimarina muelleri TaxID=279356 RepID=UPI003F686B36
MKLITRGRAPWVEIVLQEALKYKGLDEDTGKLAIAIQEEYHAYTGHPKATGNTSWCASFASWCLGQGGFNNPKSWSSQSFYNHNTLKKCEVMFGAIVVFTDCKKNGEILKDANGYTHGHVSFVFGLIEGDYYACLGGNQGDKLKVTKYDCSGNVFHSYTDKKGVKHYKKFRSFYVPKNYSINSNNNLKTYSSAKEANEELLKITINESNNGEST